jgi:hypothetical protein
MRVENEKMVIWSMKTETYAGERRTGREVFGGVNC